MRARAWGAPLRRAHHHDTAAQTRDASNALRTMYIPPATGCSATTSTFCRQITTAQAATGRETPTPSGLPKEENSVVDHTCRSE